MADTTSTTSFRADISQLKAAMQQASRQVKLANSEFKAATAGMDDWSKSADGLKAKLKQLDTTLSAQKKQLDLLEKEYEKTTKEYGENSAAADKVKIAINNQKAAIAKTEKQIDQYNDELNEAEKENDQFADSVDDMSDASEKASEGFTVMKGALADLVAQGIRFAISEMKELAKQTLEAGMNFEQGMAQVKAISGASAEEMQLLTDKAKEMGAKTKFSATESAEAFNYMAMAGWEVDDMLNGIEGIMNLAAASGADLATTSDIVTDALTAMGYSAGDAGKLADVMAAASSSANTNVELMGQTFQYAAPLVGALGYNMEDTAVQIGLMANAGIKGTKAGTALRGILSRLSAPPKEAADAMDELGISLTDSEGNMKSLDEVMQDLRDAFSELDETQQAANAKAIAGQNAMAGLLAIVNAAPDDYNRLTQAVKDSEGASESMANTMNDTVEGQLTLLKSQIEGIQIQIYEKLVPSLRDGIDTISETLGTVNWDEVGTKLGNFVKKALDFGVKIIDNGEGIISVLQSIGTVLIAAFAISKVLSFASAIGTLWNVFKTLKTATDAATTSQLLLNAAQAATPVGLVAAAVAGLAAGVVYLASKNDEATESTKVLTEFQEEQIDKINEMQAAYRELAATRDENVEAIQNEFGYYQELAEELDGLVEANGKVKEGYEDRVNFIVTTLNEACGTEIQLIDGVIQNYKNEKLAIEQLIESKKAEAVLRANEEMYTAAIQNRDEALQNLTTAQGIYSQNLSNLEKAEADLQAIRETNAAEYAEANGLLNYNAAVEQLAEKEKAAEQEVRNATAALGESNVALHNAQNTYDGYISTIQNYEGLSSAIISGDTNKINAALTDMTYNFQTAESATKDSLEQQVKNYEANLQSLETAIKNGTPSVTEDMVQQAKTMVKKAKAELDKAPDDFFTSSKNIHKAAVKGLQPTGDEDKAGENFDKGYAKGIRAQEILAKNAATDVGTGSVNSLNTSIGAHSPAKKTQTSGENFGQGFINGMKNKTNEVWNMAKSLAQKAIDALKKGQQEGSPSKLTYKSGVNFVLGYINGIVSQNKLLQTTVQNMVTSVVKELSNLSNYNFDAVAQNASTKFSDAMSKKIDYAMNRLQYENEQKLAEFDANVEKLNAKETSKEKKLQKASDKKVKKIESDRDKKVKKIQAEIDKLGTSDADKKKKKSLQDEIKKTKETAKKKIDAEKKSAKKQIEASKKENQKLVDAEKANKEAYQKASSEMISEYQKAMQEYQSQAQALIDDTINGITDKYSARYDELVSKQEDLISKLKSAGNLFDISGAGIMTVNDINEQTRQIKEYTSKLQQIKKKVSSELFDEIASFDMKEGAAYMDRLLEMSASELAAYNDAYTEKMKAAEEAGDLIYKSDFENLERDYQNEINKAFADLPKQLEELGVETMKGFISGLTEDTDYMSTEIKTYIQAMVDTFKKELKIASPSKVMELLGDYTGIGFIEGLKDTIKDVKKTASEIATAASNPLNIDPLNVGNIRAAYAGAGGLIQGGTTVNNYYDLVQNNTSPKALTALETYTARRQQIALIKAFTK